MGLPRWKPLRIVLGIAFLIGGVFSILPVLGLWMLPVGFLILSADLRLVRRLRRRMEVAYGRRRRKRTVRTVS